MPLYRTIAQHIKSEIQAGNFIEGETIPTEKSLSEQFDASRVTVRQAIDLLVTEGMLHKVQGSGTYVKEQAKVEHNIYELVSFTEEMTNLDKQPENKILNFQMIQSDARIQRKLQLDSNAPVYYIRRQRFIDDIPYVVEDTYMPVHLFPDLTYQVMVTSKYDYIENQKGFQIKESFQEVLPILPDSEIAELLNTTEQQPILKVKSYSVLSDDIPFEYSEVYFKSDEYRFTVRARRP